MLSYMSGIEIGKSKRKSGGSHQRKKHAKKHALKKHFKSSLEKLHKLSPKEALKHARATYKQLSPLNKMRMKKALKEARKKELQYEQGEPFNLDMPETPESENFLEEGAEQAEESGEDEVNAPEFDEEGAPDSETEGEGLGNDVQIAPAFSGKAERKAKKSAKVEKIKAKAGKRTAEGEAKKMRAQAKMTKAEKGGGALKDLAEGLKSGGDKGDQAPEPSWFEKNKMLVLGGGALLLVGGIALSKRGKH